MSFWTNNDVIPKRNFRFLIQFDTYTGQTGGVLWFAKNAKLPNLSFGETEHDFLDNKFYYPGRASWEEVTLTLVDPASPDATQKTMEMLESCGYSVKKTTDLATPKTISKKKAAVAGKGVGNVVIKVIDDDGKDLESWTLNNAWIKSVSFSDLDYTNEDLRTIDMSIRYDWATCQITASGRTGVSDSTHFPM